MSMTEAIDTLKIYERLKNAELSEAAAKGIAEVIKDVAVSHLVTGSDLELTRKGLADEIEKTRTELKADIGYVRTELKADIEKTKVELKADIEKVRLEFKADIERSKSSTIKWVAVMIIGQAGVITALVKLL